MRIRWSRAPEGVHYLNHMEDWESFPLSAVDTIGILVAVLVIGFVIRVGVQSYQDRNFERFLLVAVVAANLALVLFSAQADGSYYRIRRYLLFSGIVFMIMLGIRLAQSFEAHEWVVTGILALLPMVSLYHQFQMLREPDQLAAYRQTVNEIERAGYRYGISWYSYSHTLTALSGERVVFGVIDHTIESPYQKPALAQEVVVLVWPAVNAPPFEFAQKLLLGRVAFKDEGPRVLPGRIRLFGQDYQRIGEPKTNGELGWAPYRKLPGAVNSATPQP